MAEYTAAAVQTVQVNQNVAFTETICDDCKYIMHREGSGTVKLFPKHDKCLTRFFVAFSGNVAIPTGQALGQISLAITIDGEPSSIVMTIRPAAVEQFGNVAGFAYVYVKQPCCSTVAIRNTSTIPIEVTNANLLVKIA